MKQPRQSAVSDPEEGNPDQKYSIGDLAEEFDVTTRAIRFYETKGLLTPPRDGAIRFYTRRDHARLALILRGTNLGFSLEEIAEYLKLYDADPAHQTQTRHLLERVDAQIDILTRKRTDLERTLRELKTIRAHCITQLKSSPRSKS